MSHRAVLLLVVAVLALGVAAAFFHPSRLLAPSTVNDAISQSGDSQQKVDTRADINSSDPLTSQLRSAAASRDKRRLADVQALRQALDLSKGDHGAYPEALAGLVPDYFATVPHDPKTLLPYGYTVIGSGGDFYDLTYTLEVGSDGIVAGEHTATPEALTATE